MGTPGFNMTEWRTRHPPEAIDAIVTSTIAAIKGDFGVKKLGAVGYWYDYLSRVPHRRIRSLKARELIELRLKSFGGKYVARFLAEGKGLDAGFTAHPSGVVAEEWQGIAAPLSIAFGRKFHPPF